MGWNHQLDNPGEGMTYFPLKKGGGGEKDQGNHPLKMPPFALW